MNPYVILAVYCTHPQDLGSTMIRRNHANVVRVRDTSLIHSDGSVGPNLHDLVGPFVCVGAILGIPIFFINI
jgi:hypothetical protein